MAKTGVRLPTEYEQYRDEMAGLLPLIDEARSRLATVSEIYPGRKQRRKTRQANFDAWPNELWYEGNKDRDWLPRWLDRGSPVLLKEYSPLSDYLNLARKVRLLACMPIPALRS